MSAPRPADLLRCALPACAWGCWSLFLRPSGLGPRETTLLMFAVMGVSLLPLLAGGELERRPPLVARTAGPGPLTSIRRGELKATFESQSKRWSLHDVGADFDEARDLAAERPAELEELRAELAAWWTRWRPSVAERRRIPLTPELRAHLEALGYADLPAAEDLQGEPADR